MARQFLQPVPMLPALLKSADQEHDGKPRLAKLAFVADALWRRQGSFEMAPAYVPTSSGPHDGDTTNDPSAYLNIYTARGTDAVVSKTQRWVRRFAAFGVPSLALLGFIFSIPMGITALFTGSAVGAGSLAATVGLLGVIKVAKAVMQSRDPELRAERQRIRSMDLASKAHSDRVWHAQVAFERVTPATAQSIRALCHEADRLGASVVFHNDSPQLTGTLQALGFTKQFSTKRASVLTEGQLTCDVMLREGQKVKQTKSSLVRLPKVMLPIPAMGRGMEPALRPEVAQRSAVEPSATRTAPAGRPGPLLDM